MRKIEIIRNREFPSFQHTVTIDGDWICSLEGLNLEKLLLDFGNLTKEFEFSPSKHAGDCQISHIELHCSPFREICIDIIEIVFSHTNKKPEDLVEMKLVPIQVFEHLSATNQYFCVLRFSNKEVTFIPFDLSTYHELGLKGLRELVLLRRLKRVFNVEQGAEKSSDSIIEIDLQH